VRLTPHQRRVLVLAALGHSEQETAALLHTSPHTVKTHRKNLLRRLSARNMANALAVALVAGELDLGDLAACPPGRR